MVALATNVMYFETGQGSALSANAHHGVDQQTLEARAYAVARRYRPMLVNSVVGFIGPEYLYDGKQITRAGLEDHFCGKAVGASHGLRRLLYEPRRSRSGRHGAAHAAGRGGGQLHHGVPGADDVMLQLSEHQLPRCALSAPRAGTCGPPEFEQWLAGDCFHRLALEAQHPERLLA